MIGASADDGKQKRRGFSKRESESNPGLSRRQFHKQLPSIIRYSQNMNSKPENWGKLRRSINQISEVFFKGIQMLSSDFRPVHRGLRPNIWPKTSIIIVFERLDEIRQKLEPRNEKLS